MLDVGLDKLEKIMTLSFKNVNKLAFESSMATNNGTFTDIHNMPDLFQDDEVVKFINPILLQVLKGGDEKDYVEFISLLKQMDVILLRTMQRLAYMASKRMGKEEIKNQLDPQIQKMDATYGRQFFQTDILIDNAKSLKDFDISKYKK